MSILGRTSSTPLLGNVWGGQLRQFALYGVASVTALAVDYGLLIFLAEYVGFHYLISASISFLVGGIVVYFASILHIFDQRRLSNKSIEITSFMAIGVVGLAMNGLLIWAITEGTPISYQLAKLPTAGIVFLFNYVARRSLLFSAP